MNEREIEILKSYSGSMLFLFIFMTLLSSPGIFLIVSGIVKSDYILVIAGGVIFAGLFAFALVFLVDTIRCRRDASEGLAVAERGIVTGYRRGNKSYSLYVNEVRYDVQKDIYDSFGKGVEVEIDFGPRSGKVLAVRSGTKEVRTK
jgi:hypothetical protein